MRASHILLLLLAVLLATTAVAAGPAALQSVELMRAVVASGATRANADGVTLRATLGQPFVGSNASDGITLGHGFWHGAAVDHRVYLPLVLLES
jgi:hypothetical protein